MNKMLKKALILGAIGFVVGFLIGVFMWYLGVKDNPSVHYDSLTFIYCIVGGIFGASAMGSTVVYDVESWSITRCTITHFVFVFAGFYLMAYIQNWDIFWNIGFLYVTIPEIIGYIIIWLIQYLIARKQVKKMNEELKDIRNDLNSK